MGSPQALVLALRPHQWVKNVFVLAALLFRVGERGIGATPIEVYWRVAAAFGAFCLGSSALYLVNDVVDIEADRTHPKKRERPIAAGKVSVRAALMLSAGCVIGAALLGALASTKSFEVGWVVVGYMLLNTAYSFKLKHIVLVDAFSIASGFLLRVVGGGLAAAAPVSHWLILCTLYLALFLALCKRRAELDLLGSGAGEHRKNLRDYTPGFIDQATVVLAACAILCYTMYTVAEDTAQKFGPDNGLVWTVPFVVFGLFRYLLLVQTQQGGGSPTRVLLGGDVTFVVNCLAWLTAVCLLLFT